MGFGTNLLISFGLGFAANLNPCVLPLYPGYLSYIASNPDIKNKQFFTRLSGILVVSGVLLFMIIIGAITAGFNLSITNFVNIVSPIAFGVLILLGVVLLFDFNIGKYISEH